MMVEQSNALPNLGGLSPEMLAGQDPVSFAKTKAAADIFAKKEAAAKSERAGRAESELYKSYGSALTQPYETFKPTPESGSGFMALGTLMLVAGSMMGGKGKMAGIGAMNNIAGMMDGYKSGRKELYEQERQMFEENLKTQEKNRALIKEAFDQALKVAKYDLTGAKNMLEQRLTALGADIPKQMVQKNGVIAAASVMQQADVNHDKMMSTVKSKLTPKEMIAIEDAGRTAKAAAEKEAIGEIKDAKYGELGGVLGTYTPRQIYEAAKKGQTFVEKSKPAELTALQVKEDEDRINLAKALHEDFVRTKQEPVIKDEKLLAAYKKLFPDAPFRISSETTRQPVIDDEGYYRNPVTMERLKDPANQFVKAGGSRATSWIKSIDDDGKPVYRDKVTKDIITESDGTPVRPPESGKKDAGLKPGVAEVKNYDDHQIMLEDISYLKKKLSDPEFKKKIDQYRWMTYLSDDVNKAMTLMMQEKIPADVADFVRSASILRNAYYLAISGKAVTGGEAQRNYTVVPQPGDKSSVFEQKLDSMERYLKRSTKVLEYTYPDLEERRKKVESMQTEDDQPSSSEKDQAIKMFGAYEPNKYEYGINPNTGKFARREK